MSKYWNDYWNSKDIHVDLQTQVERTYKKKQIDTDIWEKTLDFVTKQLEMPSGTTLLELCCGNGMLTLPLAQKANRVTAVDFSVPLLEVLRKNAEEQSIYNIKIVNSDINTIYFSANSFSHILMYTALQHFTEQETILLFEKTATILEDRGIFYIGDIPNHARLWDFANTDAYVSAYFDSVKAGTPAIGTWFIQDDLVKMAHYAGFSDAKIIEQPSYQINSRYRFDLRLQK